MSDGLGGIGKQVTDTLFEIPKDIVSDAVDQVSGNDGQKALEQGQSSDDTISQQQVQNVGSGNSPSSDLAKAQKEQEDQVRMNQIRANLARIEADVETERQKRQQREQDREEEWQMLNQKEEQEKQIQTKKAQNLIDQMMMREMSGSGETGKRTG